MNGVDPEGLFVVVLIIIVAVIVAVALSGCAAEPPKRPIVDGPMPPGIKNNREFGELVGWGKGAEEAQHALDTLSERDIERMQQAGLKASDAKEWGNQYSEFAEWVKPTPNNPNAFTPAIHGKLMLEIADRLDLVENPGMPGLGGGPVGIPSTSPAGFGDGPSTADPAGHGPKPVE